MLYFVRHGESQANVDQIFAGPDYYAPLTEKGRQQAADEGVRLKNESITFDTIISSTIERAKDTAALIAEGMGFDVNKIQYDPRLVEYDMGALSGQSMIGIEGLDRIAADGAEDPVEFRDRIKSAIDDASKIPGNTLLVSHAGVGRMIEVIRTGSDPVRFYELETPTNAKVVEIKPFDYKALVLDLDGTTVASAQDSLPSERVINAVQAAQKILHVAVATGRPYNLALPVVKALGLHGPSVFNGGAEIVDVDTGEVLHSQFLSKDEMQELAKLAIPFGYDIYTDEDQYSTPIKNPDEITKGAAKLFVDTIKTSDAIKMLEELAAVETASAHPTTSWGTGDVVDIHVTHINGTKRHGVEKLIEILDIAKDEVIAIGDSHNDMPLLEAAGFKVAMGNAPDEVKAVADHVAPSLEDDGVADTIEQFILHSDKPQQSPN